MNPVYSSPDIDIIRSAYRARDMVIFDPCVVVMQAQVASIPAAAEGTYLQINFDTVSSGAYTAIKTGMMVLISETDDHTDYLYEMRVAGAPSASILPVNESAFTLAENQYITVINTYKPLPRVRAGALVDGRLAYQGLPATVNGLPSALYVESAIEGVFNLSVSVQTFTGVTVSSTLFDIPDVVYLTGAATDLDVEIEMPADSHTWGRFTYTLSNGVTGYMAFQLIVQDPENPTLATVTIDQLRLNRTWQGHHATCRAFAGVPITQVMNGTRAVIVSRRQYKGGTLTGAMDNVSFVGYLAKENNSTQSRNDKSVTFEITSIWERAGQLPMNPIAIRDVASPTKWDEINLPTAQRVVTHVLARYSTILNLCSLNLDEVDSTWYGGDMDVNSSSLGDAMQQVLSELNAEIIQNPSGELYLRRDLRFEDDTARDAADVVWTLTEADLRSLDVSVRHDEKTGRIIIGFRGYQTSRVPSKGGKSVAPAVILGTSPETQTRANQLMPADLTDAQLLTAARDRSGNLLAAENPPFEMTGTTRGNLSWLNTSCHQWITISLNASATTRRQSVSVRSLLVSLELSYLNREGDHDLTIELLPETRGGGALIVAALTPNVSGLSMFVLPPMPAYGGNYGGPSSLNGANQRFNRQNMGGMGVPIPPDQSYEEGQYAPQNGWITVAISYKNPSNVATGFVTTLGETYRVKISGLGNITSGATVEEIEQRFDEGDDGGYTEYINGAAVSYGTYMSDGWAEGFPGRIIARKDASGQTFTGAVAYLNRALTPADGFVANYIMDWGVNPAAPAYVTAAVTTYSDIYTFPAFSTAAGIGFEIGTTNAIPDVRLTKIVWTGDLIATSARQLDAFYSWEIDEESGEPTDVQLHGASAGLFFDNSAVTVPSERDPSGNYEVEFTGTGSVVQIRFEYPDYTNVAPLPLFTKWSGDGTET